MIARRSVRFACRLTNGHCTENSRHQLAEYTLSLRENHSKNQEAKQNNEQEMLIAGTVETVPFRSITNGHVFCDTHTHTRAGDVVGNSKLNRSPNCELLAERNAISLIHVV